MTRSFGYTMLIASALAADSVAAPAPLAKAPPTEAKLLRALEARGVVVEKIERVPVQNVIPQIQPTAPTTMWVARLKLCLPSGEETRITKRLNTDGTEGLAELLREGDARQLHQEFARDHQQVFNFYLGFNR